MVAALEGGAQGGRGVLDVACGRSVITPSPTYFEPTPSNHQKAVFKKFFFFEVFGVLYFCTLKNRSDSRGLRGSRPCPVINRPNLEV